MSSKNTTGTQLPWGTEIVKNSDGDKIGWVDNKGDVHKSGDSGGIFGNPDTIGHVDRDGNVHMDKD